MGQFSNKDINDAWQFLRNHKLFGNMSYYGKASFLNYLDYDLISINPATDEIDPDPKKNTKLLFQCDLGLFGPPLSNVISNRGVLLSENTAGFAHTFSGALICLAKNIYNKYGLDRIQLEKNPEIDWEPQNVYQAWDFICRHAIFIDEHSRTRFHECTNIFIYESVNGGEQSLYCRIVSYYWNLQTGQGNPLQQAYEDNHLVAEGSTFEKMIIELANKVHEKYAYGTIALI